ncbi:hypothetical protein [Komagataeibacter oboediens]|nr:hypothetical protein [Komagataeibacter oboediens]
MFIRHTTRYGSRPGARHGATYARSRGVGSMWPPLFRTDPGDWLWYWSGT